MRLKSDLVDIVDAVIDGKLNTISLDIDPRPTVCVVMASGGYPGSYKKGKVITGLAKAAKQDSVVVFHAGTAMKKGKTVTAGGRVLGVTALGNNLDAAISNAYKTAGMIKWSGCFYRKDIGAKAARHTKKTAKTEAVRPTVGIVMGSDSDLPVMQAAADFLESMKIPFEIRVSSAHRTPEAAAEYARTALTRGVQIIIAGAGMAAHLAGVLAAHTNIPIIGVPIDGSSLNGLDALLSTVQMPPGVPVATMGIGKAGAKNAGVLAARILALQDKMLAARLDDFKKEMAVQVEKKNKKLASR
jgi:phosphoribosylamine--glycine ligase